MKITTVQCDIEWMQKEKNLGRLSRLIDDCEATDIIVLPEMFATGFCMDSSKIAESVGGEVQQWMLAEARKHNAAVVGSVATQENGNYYNRLLFVEPDGTVTAYDKRHLFTYSGENKNYSAGEERIVAEFRGARILLQVCYDLRFPVWSRNQNDYDVAIYVASWPTSRIAVWDTLLKARAIENQCFVVGVNRVGTDPACEYPGHSTIIHPYGKAITIHPESEESCITTEIDMENLFVFRDKFPVLHDSDRFQLKP